MTSHIKAANSDLDLSGKRCVVVGGTREYLTGDSTLERQRQ